ncbi:MAG: T9SS type A sorting domain-containing protein [Sphingobacteriales bacterium]|nr:T9SS type A sorting domain-containing protein [Sphingobacteriales bacterium]
MKRVSLYLFLNLLVLCSFAQELTKPMTYSAVLNNAYREYQLSKTYSKATADTLSLPFIDDFSYNTIYPNSKKWTDVKVFINNSFAIKPPSKGVATFDGFNEFGRPYVESEFSYGVCDTLTSQPINLNLPASDSIYISFYIQPQGNGRTPAVNDSLILEFKNMTTGKFTKVKSWAGSANKDFRYVLIPITNPVYLQKGFQFRFKNKGSQYGADDHWHLDYVKLDRLRSINDTSLLDVSINSNATSLLLDYTAVPWNQFDINLLAENHFVNIKNNFKNSSNVDFTFKSYIKNIKLDSVTKGLFLASGITSKEESKKVNIPTPTAPFEVNTTYTSGTNNDVFEFNDTLRATQIFHDYYALDDGTAEDGYGVSASANGRFAYKFNARNSDTISAVQFHFTQKQVPIVNQIFTLTIWKSLSPEVILYQQTSLSPSYIDSLNGFTTFKLDSIVELSGDFYVGWIQSVNYFMNVGLDRNTINNSHMFYKVNSTGWQQSGVLGSVMIRPVFGDRLETGIGSTKKKENVFVVYPNPGAGVLSIKYNVQSTMYKVQCINLQGQLVHTSVNLEKIDISNLSKGMYFIQLLDENNQILGSQKYLKNE